MSDRRSEVQPNVAIPDSEEPAQQSTEPESEPRLSYESFVGDVPTILHKDVATCLCVSDKLLALGTRSGGVYLLDYEGNKVKGYQEHNGPVTDLNFDGNADTLASCSLDGYVVLYGLYSGDVQRIKCGQPITTVALDPRHSSRKTKEFYYGTASGALYLSSKGWLGNSETLLFQGKGRVHTARVAGTMLAWVTDSGIRLYDTSVHLKVGHLDRPSSVSESGNACSLVWVGDREILVGWGRHVLALGLESSSSHSANSTNISTPNRTGGIIRNNTIGDGTTGSVIDGGTTEIGSTSNAGTSHSMRTPDSSPTKPLPVSTPISPLGTPPPAPPAIVSTPPPPMASGSAAAGTAGTAAPGGLRMQVLTEFELEDEDETVLGVAPFGRQLAVLTRTQPLRQTSTSTDEDAAGEMQIASTYSNTVSLKVFDRSGNALFSDDIELEEYHERTAKRRSTANGLLQQPRITLEAFFSLNDVIAHANKTTKLSRKPSLPLFWDSDLGEQLSSATTSAVPLVQGRHEAQQAEQPFKWWSDGAEPLYYVISPDGIVVGRPRYASDRIAWLAERLRFPEALTVAETDISVRPGARLALAEQYLTYLCSTKQYQEAADLCPRVLRDDAAAWERWIYTFGQEAQLPLLAPKLPITNPVLSSAAYDMALVACLRSPAEHDVLRSLVDAWSPGIYDAAGLLALVSPRLRPSTTGTGANIGPSASLRYVAAALNTQLGNHEAALRLLLSLRSFSVFNYIRTHNLESLAASLAPDLIDLDEVKATSMLVETADVAQPAAVVASLQLRIQASDAMANAEQAKQQQGEEDQSHLKTATTNANKKKKEELPLCADNDEPSRWSLRLYHYLDWLRQRDTSAAAPFAQLHVELCAIHDPDRLLHLLTSSSDYPLDAALKVCESGGLVRESIYVLGRMGCSEAALRLIVGRLRDVEGAVAFVQEARDEELWELLISLTLGDAALAGDLLDHAGGGVDPLRLVAAIPEEMQIERLRDRLVRVISDFRAALSLQSGCNAVLRTDCLELGDRLYSQLRRALKRMCLRRPGGQWVMYEEDSGRESKEESSSTSTENGGKGGEVSASPAASAAEAAWQLVDGGGPMKRKVWIGLAAENGASRKSSLIAPTSLPTPPRHYPRHPRATTERSLREDHHQPQQQHQQAAPAIATVT